MAAEWQGQSMGGGGADNVGGIVSTVEIDEMKFNAQIARVKAGLEGLESNFASVGAVAATATTRVDAGMRNASKSANAFGYQLQVVGQSLDDLQYIGEQGLRPIINNLMQISPVLGIAAIAFDQFRKSGDGARDTVASLLDYAQSLADAFDIKIRITGEGADPGVAAAGAAAGRAALNAVGGGAIGKLLNALGLDQAYIDKISPTLGEVTGATRRAEQARIDKFEGEADPDDKERAKTIIGAISKYGNKKFLDEMTDPAGNAEVTRKEKADLLGLIDRVKKFEPGAMAELEERTRGKGVGEAIRESLPETKARREAEDRFEQAGHARALADQKARDAYRANLLAGEQADAADSDANFRKHIKDKLKRGERLTPGERAGVDADTREAEQGMLQGQLDRSVDHMTRLNGLGRRLREAMAPEIRNSMVMDSSQLNASVQASVTNGPSAEEKRLVEVRDAVQAIGDEIVRFNKPVRAGGR